MKMITAAVWLRTGQSHASRFRTLARMTGIVTYGRRDAVCSTESRRKYRPFCVPRAQNPARSEYHAVPFCTPAPIRGRDGSTTCHRPTGSALIQIQPPDNGRTGLQRPEKPRSVTPLATSSGNHYAGLPPVRGKNIDPTGVLSLPPPIAHCSHLHKRSCPAPPAVEPQ
jgi:hypothetical protein